MDVGQKFRSAVIGAVAALSFAGPAAAQDWTGLYGGLSVGGIYGDFTNSVPSLPGPTKDSFSGLFGFNLGYNWQNGDTVLGGEADFSFMNLYGSSAGGRFDEDTMATLRFRGGKVYNGSLFYGTLGLAFTEKEHSLTGLGSTSDYETGLTLGAGVERWVGQNTTGRVELLYIDVPKDNQSIGATTVSGGSTNLAVRLGINMHF